MIIQICVGSSCHLKGAPEIVERFRRGVEEHGLEQKVTLAGSFCIGACNREGVTVQIDDQVFPGITVEGFDRFFREQVLEKVGK